MLPVVFIFKSDEHDASDEENADHWDAEITQYTILTLIAITNLCLRDMTLDCMEVTLVS